MKNFIQKSSKINQTSANATLTVAAPGGGKYNCLTYISVDSDAACNITITGKATWIFKLVGAGGWTAEFPEENTMMGSENTALTIAVSAGNYNINVIGFVTP